MPEKNERECGAAGEFRPRIRSEGAADRNEREFRPRIGSEGAADRNEREFRPRIGSEGAADRNEREFPAASPPPLKKAGPIRIRLLVDLT